MRLKTFYSDCTNRLSANWEKLSPTALEVGCIKFSVKSRKQKEILTKKEHKNIKLVKYVYPIGDPQLLGSALSASGAHGDPDKQESIISCHASPVAHLLKNYKLC